MLALLTTRRSSRLALLLAAMLAGWACSVQLARVVGETAPATAADEAPNVDWSQWGGSPGRNNTPTGRDVPVEWEVGDFDYETGDWDPTDAKNVKWVAKLGSQTYGNATVHGGKVFIGTNNSGGWLKRYPGNVDLGCLICFDLKTGKFLWQHSSEKLPTGRVHDWPLQGICCAPYCEGDRLWFVTSRGEVRCLDVEGFHDGENDGPFVDERQEVQAQADAVKQPYDMLQEADVVWVYNMMTEMGVSQHNMCSCSITCVGDVLFVMTSNGVDVEHNYIPAPDAPSFFAMNKHTGEVLWTDNSPRDNIHHGQWSSPAYGEFDGQAQVLFGGGDGWLYAFDPAGDGQGGSKLLWKFDTNPKLAKLELMGKGTRNDIIATPVVYDGLVYVATGQDPEHGEGIGGLWCIDPHKRGDVSPELVFNAADPQTPIAYKRVQAAVPEEGDIVRPNPNSAVVWKYDAADYDGDGEIAFEEVMHRTIGTVAIRDDILYIADYSGLFHCLNAKTGERNWVYDMLSASWGSPLIVEDKVYIGDEDGEVAIFRHSADPNVAMQQDGGMLEPYYGTRNMGNSVYSTPIVADNILLISNRSHLFAITPEGQ
ncbi:MAG: PQQ-binding-like beta-propeller repeat protein [Pirellulales bacterium]|nr:PQQ-binding-like beta-propeller repeat protein [Pirellulales bacterium]